MKHETQVPLNDQMLCLLDGITFAQTPYWFPFYNYRDLKLDILRPFGPVQEKMPLLVWICGGGWVTMDRCAHIPYLTYFAKRGYIVASVEYRLSNCATLPSQLQDIKSAIRYLRAHADQYGIDAGRIAVMGESAGGFLASLAGTTSDETQWDTGDYVDQSSAVRAVVDFYGPSDLGSFANRGTEDANGRPRVDALLLGYSPAVKPEEATAASPIAHVKKETPPFFILHGTADNVVPAAQSESLYEALQKAGVPAEYYLIEGAGHAGPQFYQDSMSEKIIAFLDGILK